MKSKLEAFLVYKDQEVNISGRNILLGHVSHSPLSLLVVLVSFLCCDTSIVIITQSIQTTVFCQFPSRDFINQLDRFLVAATYIQIRVTAIATF